MGDQEAIDRLLTKFDPPGDYPARYKKPLASNFAVRPSIRAPIHAALAGSASLPNSRQPLAKNGRANRYNLNQRVMDTFKEQGGHRKSQLWQLLSRSTKH